MTKKNDEKRSRVGWENPAYVAFLNPFHIIRPDTEPDFTVPLEEINSNTYNHGLLCRVVTSLITPKLLEAPLLVCADGAIAIPALPNLQSLDDVLDIFNHVMCSLLLGGHACEAIDSRDVVTGNLHENELFGQPISVKVSTLTVIRLYV